MKKFWIAWLPPVGDMIRLEERQLSELDGIVERQQAEGPIFRYLFREEHAHAKSLIEKLRAGEPCFNDNKLGRIGMGLTKQAALRELVARIGVNE